MLNINLILKIKKEFNISIGKIKQILEKNNWEYKKSIFYIKKEFNINKSYNFKFNSILTVKINDKILLIKILYNTIILQNSTILEKFIKNLKLIDLNYIKDKIRILSIEINEFIFLKKIIIYLNKNLFFYNHKKIFFCIIKHKKEILNICCHIIFNKINFINFNCKKCLKNQLFLKNNVFIFLLFNINLIEYISFINHKNEYFYYE